MGDFNLAQQIAVGFFTTTLPLGIAGWMAQKLLLQRFSKELQEHKSQLDRELQEHRHALELQTESARSQIARVTANIQIGTQETHRAYRELYLAAIEADTLVQKLTGGRVEAIAWENLTLETAEDLMRNSLIGFDKGRIPTLLAVFDANRPAAIKQLEEADRKSEFYRTKAAVRHAANRRWADALYLSQPVEEVAEAMVTCLHSVVACMESSLALPEQKVEAKAYADRARELLDKMGVLMRQEINPGLLSGAPR